MPKIIVSDSDGEREVGLQGDITVGRIAENDIVIKVPEASRTHCRVLEEGGAWFVEDLGSSNGTRVNGRRVTKFELQDGDEIQVGIARMRFLESEASAPAPEEPDEIDLEEIDLEDDDGGVTIRFLNSQRKDEVVDLTARTTVGRKSSNTIAVTEKGVSGTHAEFVREGGVWRVRDLGSTNGTMVNGEGVSEADLAAGDVVKIGIVQFLVGVDGNEGGDTLRSTVIVEGAELDDEVFAISEANMRRKQKTATVLWLLFFVAILGSAVFWVMQDTTQSEETVEIVSIAGNCITRGASFEPSDEFDEYLTTESDEVDFEEDRKYRHSGEHALRVDASGGGPHYVAFLEEVKNISSSENLEIGAWFRTSSLNGVGGLALVWLSPEGTELGRSHLNAGSGLSSFTEVRGSFHPPEGTERARLAVALHDATGKIWIDDVFALRRRGDSRDSMSVAGFDVMLDSSGALTISRDGQDVVAAAGIYWVEDGRVRATFGWSIGDAVERAEASTSVSGEIVADSKPSGSFSTMIGKTDVGVKVTANTQAGGGVAYGFLVRPADGVVTVTEDGAIRHGDAFSRDGVKELVIATGPRAVRLAFDPPQTVAMSLNRNGDGTIRLPFAAADDGLGVELAFQLDFDREREEVLELDQRAQRADLLHKRYGEAMTLYQEIVNRFSFRKDVADRAAASRARLQDKGEKLISDLGRRVDDTVFFRTFATDYADLSQELRAAIASYEGVDIATRLSEINDELEAAFGQVDQATRTALAENHLARGVDLLTPGRSQPTLARGFFLSVLQLAPDSELAETAKEHLKTIETLVGRK